MKTILKLLVLMVTCSQAFCLAPDIPLQVWANQAIVNTFTFNSSNLTARQQDMAKDFTPKAWSVYLAAFEKTNILKQVTKHHYQVTAVATMPPSVKQQGHLWQVTMPLLVKYQSSKHTETQHLELTLMVGKQGSSFAIVQYHAKILTKPCRCQKDYYPKVTIA